MAEETTLDPKSLEGLLRARARKVLCAQTQKIVDRLTASLPQGGRLKIETSGRDNLVPSIQPRGAGYEITLDLRQLAPHIVALIVNAHEKEAGDTEIAEFMGRVDGVFEEIEQLRNGGAES